MFSVWTRAGGPSLPVLLGYRDTPISLVLGCQAHCGAVPLTDGTDLGDLLHGNVLVHNVPLDRPHISGLPHPVSSCSTTTYSCSVQNTGCWQLHPLGNFLPDRALLRTYQWPGKSGPTSPIKLDALPVSLVHPPLHRLAWRGELPPAKDVSGRD